jgi:type IV fimbrial biogenesis protein FimT
MKVRTVKSRHQAGLTLIESLMALAVVGVLLGSVLPAFGTALERRHLEGAAAQLKTDIQYTRSQAVAANEPLRMRFQQHATGSCYVVHNGPAQACSCLPDGSASCGSDGQSYRSVGFAREGSVQLQSNVNTILFSPHLGTITPAGTLRLTGREARTVQVVVNLMGRVRTCSPGASVTGYAAC